MTEDSLIMGSCYSCKSMSKYLREIEMTEFSGIFYVAAGERREVGCE